MNVNISNTLGPALGKLAKKYPKIVRDGIARMAFALMEDAGNKKYRPSFDTGNLEGSWFVSVEGKTTDSGPYAAGVSVASLGPFTAQFGYSAEYAAAQHENLWPAGPWQPKPPHDTDTPTRGGFFLSRKMEDADEYATVLVDYIRSQLQ